MSIEKEKYISETLLKEKPQKPPLKFKLGDGVVNLKNLSEELAHQLSRIDDLQNQINSLIEGGVAVSNEFGNNPHISISQKTLTDAINRIWAEIDRITGESRHGISMAVTPSYFIGNNCTLHISANTVNTVGMFEHIRFFYNSEVEPFLSYDNVWGIDDVEVELPLDKLINQKVIIRCEAQILGIIYEDSQTVTRYNNFFLGAGADYTDLMIDGYFNPNCSIPAAHHMRGAYDLYMSQGDHIIIVMGAELEPEFIRADINGMEIPFGPKQTITVDGEQYVALTSIDTYQEGWINIDING